LAQYTQLAFRRSAYASILEKGAILALFFIHSPSNPNLRGVKSSSGMGRHTPAVWLGNNYTIDPIEAPQASLLTSIVSLRRHPMKTLTGKELGGTCDQKLSANTWDEMVQKMTKHVMDKHPDVAKDMEKMHNEDPQKWGKEMKPKFDAAGTPISH
jgi:predicted small metal-binding protein